MFGFFKSPGNNKLPNESSNNKGGTITAGRRTSSEPILITPDFADDDKYKNGFSDSGGLQSQTTEELENYAVYKAEETTKGVNNCLKIAEDIRSDATRTLEMLHQQGEQINRTHVMAVDMDKDLSRVKFSLFSFLRYENVKLFVLLLWSVDKIKMFVRSGGEAFEQLRRNVFKAMETKED